jgi:ribosomal protein S28E/S33
MRRLVIPLLVGLVIALWPTGPAFATQPDFTRSGVEEFDVDIPAGGLCDFGLAIHVVQRLTVRLFVDRNGEPVRGLVTGSIKIRIMNTDSGTTITQNIPGPGFLDGNGVLVRGTGPWSIFVDSNGVPISTWGNIAFDESGAVASVRGKVVEFCPLLASPSR